MVWVLLADGFEESEVVIPVDLLRRGGVTVTMVGIYGRSVTSSHGIVMSADAPLEDVHLDSGDTVFVPGGLKGVEGILASTPACDLLRRAADLDCRLCAICAGPTVLSRLGLIDGRQAVCHPTVTDLLPPAVHCPGKQVVQDGKLITGVGAGAGFEFGLTLLTALTDADTARNVGQGVCWNG